MKYTAFIISLLVAQIIAAQQYLLFESRIYFEDAAGNKDTIEIGYDTTATSFLNPALGESNLKDPFKNDFEVRASHSLDWQRNPDECILSNKIIGSCEKIIDFSHTGKICFLGEGIIFFIKTRNQPIKISWDRNDFPDNATSCNGASFFTPDFNHHIIDPWTWIQLPDKRFACASREDQFLVNLDRNYIASNYKREYTYSTKRVFSNGVEDSILGVELNFELNSDFSPCQLVSNNLDYKSHRKNSKYESEYPNPASDYVLIQSFNSIPIVSAKIFNQRGQLIIAYNDLTILEIPYKLSIGAYTNGIYFIQLIYSDNSISYKKLMKQ